MMHFPALGHGLENESAVCVVAKHLTSFLLFKDRRKAH